MTTRLKTIIDHGRQEIHVGDFAGFKDGIEQYGRVVRIPDPSTLVLSVFDSNTGERHERHVNAYEAWKE